MPASNTDDPTVRQSERLIGRPKQRYVYEHSKLICAEVYIYSWSTLRRAGASQLDTSSNTKPTTCASHLPAVGTFGVF